MSCVSGKQSEQLTQFLLIARLGLHRQNQAECIASVTQGEHDISSLRQTCKQSEEMCLTDSKALNAFASGLLKSSFGYKRVSAIPGCVAKQSIPLPCKANH